MLPYFICYYIGKRDQDVQNFSFSFPLKKAIRVWSDMRVSKLFCQFSFSLASSCIYLRKCKSGSFKVWTEVRRVDWNTNGLPPPTKLLAFLGSDWMIFLSVMLGLSWTMGMRAKARNSPVGARQEVVQEWEACVPQEKRATKLFSGPERAGSNGSKRELWFLSGLLHSCKCHEQSQRGMNFTARARRRKLSFMLKL